MLANGDLVLSVDYGVFGVVIREFAENTYVVFFYTHPNEAGILKNKVSAVYPRNKLVHIKFLQEVLPNTFLN